MAQIGKHFKVIELLSEKYKCQTQLALLSMQVCNHTYTHTHVHTYIYRHTHIHACISQEK